MKIKIEENYADNILEVSTDRDKITLHDLTNLDESVIVAKHFLKLTYSVRSGSGMVAARTAFISSLNGKLVVSSQIVTFYSSDFEQTYDSATDARKEFDEHQVYIATSEISGDKLSSIFLTIKVKGNSKSKVERSYNYHRSATLRLDSKTGIFYNDVREIDRNFTTYDPFNHKENRVHLKGKYPVVNLPERKYIFLNNAWYLLSADIYLKPLSTYKSI